MRRGEIAALRWRNVDLSAASWRLRECRTDQGRGSLQTAQERARAHRRGVGDCREGAASYRIQQAQELLKVGIPLSDDDFVVTQADGSPLQPQSLGQEWHLMSRATRRFPVSASTICGTPTQPTC